MAQAEFDAPLTEKRSRRLMLTEAGRALAAAGILVEASHAAARASVDYYLRDPGQAVAISAFHSAGLAWFPALLARSEAELRLSDGDVSYQEFPKLALEHDIVIAHRLVHDPEWPAASVTVTPLLREPLAVLASDSHPLAARTRVTPAELIEHRRVSVHEGFPLARALDSIAAAAGAPLRIAHRVNEFFVAAAIVRESRALALMPRVTMAEPARDGLVLLEVEGMPLARQIDALVQPQAMRRRAVRDTLALLQQITSGSGGFGA